MTKSISESKYSLPGTLLLTAVTFVYAWFSATKCFADTTGEDALFSIFIITLSSMLFTFPIIWASVLGFVLRNAQDVQTKKGLRAAYLIAVLVTLLWGVVLRLPSSAMGLPSRLFTRIAYLSPIWSFMLIFTTYKMVAKFRLNWSP